MGPHQWNHLTTMPTLGLMLVICGLSTRAAGDPVTGQWEPTLQMEWWISGAGGGTLELIADPLDDDRWQSTGAVGDNWRVLTWSIIVDMTSGSPLLDIASLITKNYTAADVQFTLTVDLDLTQQLTPDHRLLGDLEVILAGSQGAMWVPEDDLWLWRLRSDGDDKGGIFPNPWRLEVEQGAVTASGVMDLPMVAPPSTSLGFGMGLMLTAGEGAYMNGVVAVPGAPAGLLLGTLLLGRRRRY